MSGKCNVSDFDEIQCVSAYMETGDRYRVKGVYYDRYGFPVEGIIELDVKNRVLRMTHGDGGDAFSFVYPLMRPLRIRTTTKLSRIEIDGRQTLIIRDDASYNRFVKLLKYTALTGKGTDSGQTESAGKGRDDSEAGGDGSVKAPKTRETEKESGTQEADPGCRTEEKDPERKETEEARKDQEADRKDQEEEDLKEAENRRRAEARIEDSESYKKLQELVGLEKVKKDVVELANLMKMQVRRKNQHLPEVPFSLHLVFSGNPGTGKTTIARILAGIYKDIGVLSKGQLVECDRGSLVAGYVGQTAIKTKEKIEEAKGGILFIDEAYTLARGENDFGQEAIDTILKAMEDMREDFIVIVAGYTDEMKAFIDSNPGLRSRFNKYIEFPDYTAEELGKIFDHMAAQYHYVLTEDAEKEVTSEITEMEKHKDRHFANARAVRNLFEKIVTNQASRLAPVPDADIRQITLEDVTGTEHPGETDNRDTGAVPVHKELQPEG